MEPFWPHFVQQCVDWLIPFSCGGLAGWTARTVRQLAALKNGMQDLLRAQLINIHSKTVAIGLPVPVDMKEEADRVYESYHALGGNGTGTRLHDAIMSAPMESETINEERNA